MVLLGIVLGAFIGFATLGIAGALAGAFVGLLVALVLRSQAQKRTLPASAEGAQPAPGTPAATANVPPSDVVADLERRVRVLEARLGIRAAEADAGSAADVTQPVPDRPVEAAVALPASAAPARVAVDVEDAPPAERPSMEMPERSGDSAAVPAAAPVAGGLRAWLTGGNALSRIGVVVLFFGVAFLLRYLAEIVTIPIELRLLGVACAGLLLLGIGARLVKRRPGYGLSLEGAGAGVLYLTTYAAFRLYDVLPGVPAFALLAGVAALTVWLALRADSQVLAALAVAGGFLAPLLVGTATDQPARLFGYFAVLNAAIFALAWGRAWRALNVLGFVFTFALGLFWGGRLYRPEHFATVEPFLVLFFLFYVAIAVLYASRGPLQHKAPVDGLLVFGVPLVGFALQAALVRDMRYGAAWSALALAVFYGVLALVLLRRPAAGLQLLARAFVVLAIIFATLAIPFAADPRWTSGWWALEAAAVYWIGCRQRQPIARAFALLLQLGAAVAFAMGDWSPGAIAFLNATFLGTLLIAVAALATVVIADRNPDATSSHERALMPFVLAWGAVWWYGGGLLEIHRAVASTVQGQAFVAYAVAGTVAAVVLAPWLRCARLRWFGAALLPAMALAAATDWHSTGTTLHGVGALVWPVAWVVLWWVLYTFDEFHGASPQAQQPAVASGPLRFAHAVSAIALVAWVAWEASEWVGRTFAEGTVWMPCAAAWPAIAGLWLATRATAWRGWPWEAHRDAYAVNAGIAIASLLAAWFVIVNVVSPGATAPLPYVPLLNPLDVTLIAAIAILFRWSRTVLSTDERTAYLWFGIAVFVFANALVFRAVHQWLDVPWRWPALFASKPLQAALTLTWTAVALPLMLVAGRRAIRPLWMVGAALLAVVVVKLFVLDLSALSGLPRVVAFLGVGALLLVIGYIAPLPPSAKRAQ